MNLVTRVLVGSILTSRFALASIDPQGALGTYELNVEMVKGGGKFQDQIEITEVTRADDLRPGAYRVKGVFSSPGLFSVPLDGFYCPHKSYTDPTDVHNGCFSYFGDFFSADFTVVENGNSTPVHMNSFLSRNQYGKYEFTYPCLLAKDAKSDSFAHCGGIQR